MIERVLVVGLGPTGRRTAREFATSGFRVVGTDPDPAAVGDPGGLEYEVSDFTPDIVASADLVVCAPEPFGQKTETDLRFLRVATEGVGHGLTRQTVVCYENAPSAEYVPKECVPVLEAESSLLAGRDFGIAYRLEAGNSIVALDELSDQVSGTTFASVMGVGVQRSRVPVSHASPAILERR